jgi:hypothetical protein
MWHLTKIPKIAHFYWGGGALSYLRFLSVKSFTALNPDWQVYVHVPSVNSTVLPTWATFQQQNVNISTDFRVQLDQLNITVITHDFDSYGFDNQAHEVHKSDFLRWKLLAEQGGLWSDIDILYLRSMANLVENCEDNADLDTILCPLSPPRKHTVGFMLGSKNNAFYQHIHTLSLANYDPNQYQCMGSELINCRYPSLNSFHEQFPQHQFAFLHRACVYVIDSKNIEQFYQPVDRYSQKKLSSSQVIGFHWFAGHPRSQAFENEFTSDNINKYNNLLTNIIKESQV